MIYKFIINKKPKMPFTLFANSLVYFALNDKLNRLKIIKNFYKFRLFTFSSLFLGNYIINNRKDNNYPMIIGR